MKLAFAPGDSLFTRSPSPKHVCEVCSDPTRPLRDRSGGGAIPVVLRVVI